MGGLLPERVCAAGDFAVLQCHCPGQASGWRHQNPSEPLGLCLKRRLGSGMDRPGASTGREGGPPTTEDSQTSPALRQKATSSWHTVTCPTEPHGSPAKGRVLSEV